MSRRGAPRAMLGGQGGLTLESFEIQLCGEKGTLHHIMSACPTALAQGRYRWRHDQVLRELTDVVERERKKSRQRKNKGPQFTPFVKEERTEEAHERKRAKYHDLAEACTIQGWKTWIFPVEVGCRGFPAQSVLRMHGALGFKGRARKSAAQAPGQAAEKASSWLWLRQNEKAWQPSQTSSA
ncbi:uncharacterized protein LOC128557258 [Mercenaria mercenaria]|uniref:uncharacterized protein LOC128557258 n=1 Tax=Mercenaria mercenaria TaxID=6596 RepID=UPI00234EC638|nr:uncharacterized protein LOC128557258 [Mercenaria mercenaria]